MTLTDGVRRAFDALHEVVILCDLTGRIALWNRAAERLYGWSAAEVLGKDIVEVVPSEASREQATQIMEALARGESWEGEFVVRHRDGTRFVAWVSDVPYQNAAGEVVGILGLSRDMSATRTAGRNLALLAALAPLLGASLDYEQAAKQACRALVPEFSDVVSITVFDDADRPTRLAFFSVEPGAARRARDVVVSPEEGKRLRGAMRGGRARLIPAAPSPMPSAATRRGRMRRGVSDPEAGARLMAPLVARGRAFGVVTFRMLPVSGRAFSEADGPFAEELGHRIGLAIENARLHTRLRASEAASTEACDRARVAEERKDSFLAMLGHELRNPLAPIVSALELMRREGPLGRDGAVIDRQVRHMVKLVDDLLDVARVSRQALALDVRPTDIAAVIASAVEMVRPVIAEHRHHLTVEVPDEGLVVDGDPTRLAQVLSNLLTNAARYTEPGGHIHVRAWRDGSEVGISVADDGAGIRSDALPRIFDAFVQHPQAPDRAKGGLGVGLTLARYLIELHGGTLVATSAGLGCGSELVARLPLAPSSRRSPVAPSELAVEASPSAPLRVLLVDDNADALELLAELLRARGHEVVTAEDGPTALLRAASWRMDVAVLDIGLPHMDGYELAERLRKLFPDLPVIAVTGYGQPSDHARSGSAGFSAHLVKPIDFEMLAQAIALAA